MGIKNIFFLFILLAALIAGFIASLNYPYSARFFPIIIISMCAISVAIELVKSLKALFKPGPDESNGQNNQDALNENGQQTVQFLMVSAWIGLFALMLWLLGFVVGLPLFVFAYVKFHSEKWRWAILLTATMFVIVYVGFVLLLKSPLHEGLLFLS